jgi:L-galactose dehydrogenase/L-glyceraldehyde 3-phosphate reductase
MVRGDPIDQERTIARAIAAGVNYFDTAVQTSKVIDPLGRS